MDEILLAVHLNPAALALVAIAFATAMASVSTRRRMSSPGYDHDDSPNGWAAIACCALFVACLIAGSSSGISRESAQLADTAFTKYGVTYLEQGAHSKVAHRVTAKPLVKVSNGELILQVQQIVDPASGDITLIYPGNGKELPLRAP